MILKIVEIQNLNNILLLKQQWTLRKILGGQAIVSVERHCYVYIVFQIKYIFVPPNSGRGVTTPHLLACSKSVPTASKLDNLSEIAGSQAVRFCQPHTVYGFIILFTQCQVNKLNIHLDIQHMYSYFFMHAIDQTEQKLLQ